MLFRTELIAMPVEKKIELRSNIAFTGSCFSNNIGQKLSERYFNVLVNPFGTVYNPVSIFQQIQSSIKQNLIDLSSIVAVEDLYVHYDYHSIFNDRFPEAVLNNINMAITNSHNFIKSTDWLFVTLGTSWIYSLKNNGHIVSNCHKQKSEFFNKRLLTLQEIKEALTNLIAELKLSNPHMNIVFTLSPVRHIKDGIIENSMSKSLLRIAISEINQDNCYYFPSYEYMMDDLRDYRFYEDDLIHPNNFAINYIWEKFKQTFFSETTIKQIGNIDKINQFIRHRPNVINETYEKNKLRMMEELDQLLNKK